MIEFGLIIFGLISGNLLLVIAWLLANAYNYIPVEYKTISVVAIIFLSLGKKILKIGG